MGLPFTCYAVDGARAADVVREQIPAFEQRMTATQSGYELGCLYIGVNDVRAIGWNAKGYESALRTALTFLGERCDRTLTLTAPLDLGRPRAADKVVELNESIERVAAELGVLIVDLSAYGARNLVMTDHVHPTAFGQIAIAERALAVLERDGVRVAVHPSSLISFETTWWKRLRADFTYLYRHAFVSLHALVALACVRLTGSPPNAS